MNSIPKKLHCGVFLEWIDIFAFVRNVVMLKKRNSTKMRKKHEVFVL